MSRQQRRSTLLFIGLAIALGVATALLHVSVRLQVIRIGYALSEETRLHRELQQQNQRLRLELATLKDPAMVEKAARERLKMAPPDPAAIRVVRGSP